MRYASATWATGVCRFIAGANFSNRLRLTQALQAA
jgi:hypothetical protein